MHPIFVSHPLIFLGGGRKSFELPCIYVVLRSCIFFIGYTHAEIPII